MLDSDYYEVTTRTGFTSRVRKPHVETKREYFKRVGLRYGFRVFTQACILKYIKRPVLRLYIFIVWGLYKKPLFRLKQRLNERRLQKRG